MPSNRLKFIVIGAIAALVVVVAVLGVVLVSLRGGTNPAAGTTAEKTTVEISDTACTPNAVTVAAGAPAFAIKNTSGRVIEWEILNGVLVLAERENIAPGFTVELAPRLEPGTYQMTCGLLSNAKGTLTVTAADGTTNALPAAPKLADLVAPTAEYRVYAITTADRLVAATAAVEAAVKAGDLPGARTHLADAGSTLAQLAPVLGLFTSEAGPLTSGAFALPALDQALAATPLDAGVPDLADAAGKAATALDAGIHATTASPRDIVAGAGRVIAALARETDLAPDAPGRIVGVRKIVELFRPLALRADRTLSAKLDADLAAVEATLGKPPVSPSTLAPQLTELAADLTALQAALGLIST